MTLTLADDDMVGTPPGPAFSGLRLYRNVDGALAVMLFQNGMITDLEPNEKDRSRPLGFYDLNMNQVADPTEVAG